MPFWKTMITPIWSAFKCMPSRKARPHTSTEFNSPTRTTFFLESEGSSVPFTTSKDTTLEAPMRAESAVDIMAAKQEQVMTVTKKYWKGPVILSCAVKPEKAVAS